MRRSAEGVCTLETKGLSPRSEAHCCVHASPCQEACGSVTEAEESVAEAEGSAPEAKETPLEVRR